MGPMAGRNDTGQWRAGRVVLVPILVVVWWALVVPLAVFLRLIGVDLMRRKMRRGGEWKTYRIEKGPR